MKKEIREVKEGIVQITIADERWYMKETKSAETGLPEYQPVPSVTWITHYYPKGIGLLKFYAQKGWDEAEQIKQAAGDKGSKVHQACVDLMDGKKVAIDAKYLNPTTELPEELTLEEYEAVMSFADWLNNAQPEVLARETVVWNDEHNYAGTRDLFCKINEEYWILDLKTSQDVWPDHALQVSGYKHASPEPEVQNAKLGILQIGYRRNDRKWKFNEVKDEFDLFLSVKKIWQKETEGVEVFKKDYPLELEWKHPAENKRSSKSKKAK